MNFNIPLFKIYWDEDDIAAVNASIRKGMNWANGPNIEEFEKLLTDYLDIKYALVFNSGTSALHAALISHNIGPGDEVIVPSFSFIATSNAVLFVGARPVFADIEVGTYGLDPAEVEKKITNKTKAILPMHYGGAACQIKALQKIAKANDLLLIEDAAESFGAEWEGQKVGTFGDSAMFSFCQTKVFTTGEGGCMVTNSRDIFEKMKLLRAHGRAETSDYFTSGEYMEYVSLGYNFRMPDMIAALGISQLKKVNKLINIRRQLAEYMTKTLLSLNIEELAIPEFPSEIYNVYQEYPIKILSGSDRRNELKKYLAAKGIGTRISFHPIHLTHFYQNVLGYKDQLKNTEKIFQQALTLPLYPFLTFEEANYICGEIANFFKKNEE